VYGISDESSREDDRELGAEVAYRGVEALTKTHDETLYLTEVSATDARARAESIGATALGYEITATDCPGGCVIHVRGAVESPAFATVRDALVRPVVTTAVPSVEPAQTAVDDDATRDHTPITAVPIAAAAPPDSDTVVVPRPDLAAAPEPAPSELAPRLRCDWGVDVSLERTVLIGRDPAPSEDDGDAELVLVPDDERSVSKTHMAVGVLDGHVWVEDRHSTNGARIHLPDGESRQLVPGIRTVVEVGTRVVFGDRSFRVDQVGENQ